MYPELIPVACMRMDCMKWKCSVEDYVSICSVPPPGRRNAAGPRARAMNMFSEARERTVECPVESVSLHHARNPACTRIDCVKRKQ
jgi:hypothetical protein